jgi:hypothetical protein
VKEINLDKVTSIMANKTWDAFRAVLAEDVKLGANKDTSTVWGRNVEREYRLPLDEPDGKARTAMLDSRRCSPRAADGRGKETWSRLRRRLKPPSMMSSSGCGSPLLVGLVIVTSIGVAHG